MKEEVKRTDAKILLHCAFIALGLACVVYGVVGFIAYRDLLAHQPSATHPTNAPDTTSYPPWAAWFYAAFPAALSLPLGFVFSLIIDFAVTVYRTRHPRNPNE
jgi:hypothetical protein